MTIDHRTGGIVLMAILLGIDTGGTYTDAVLLDDERGVLAKAKALTTKHDLAIGIHDAMETVLPAAPESIQLVSLSTTLATNAIVEGQGSPICLLLIGYQPDMLGEAGFERLLPRESIVFIAGGHDVFGEEQAPLDLAAAREAILAQAPRVSAFAISGYFGVRNPEHELRVRALVRDLTGLPVTCGHELTTDLHAPLRALTVALNARLIPLLRQLILAVQAMLDEHGIHAPLMVVKGDGSLVNVKTALERPVETILSGPAASVVGARYLAQATDAFVVDMGGTTTDIAVLRDGRPRLNPAGARVGEWQTMVEALEASTSGLGGDSEVRLEANGDLRIGPRRVVPLSLLALEYPAILETLRSQVEQPEKHLEPNDAGRFALRQRRPDSEGALTPGQREIWRHLSEGPLALSQLWRRTRHPYLYRRYLQDLIEQGLVVLSAFTPTDAVHVLGRYEHGSAEAARYGATLWARRLECTVPAFCQQVVRQVVWQLGQAVIASSLADDGCSSALDGVARLLIDRALRADGDGNLAVSFWLRRPLVAVGAPAATYLPMVASILRTPLRVPDHAEVGNAVGAVAGGVVQTARVLVRPLPHSDALRVYLPSTGWRDFGRLEEAVRYASEEARRLAEERANGAGAGAVQVCVERRDRVARGGSGGLEEIYIETEVVATAVGRPRLGHH